jgi:carboxymethylproline synthase
MFHIERHGRLVELRIAHPKPQNPFTMEMTRQLPRLCAEWEADDSVAGVVIWGGADRCFSVGGDFEEVSALSGEAATRRYVDEIIDSYLGLLSLTKPLVAALDRYCIGYGLQVALMADWRLGTVRSSLHMPELKGGLACPLGSVILEALLGRARMLHMVIGNGGVPAPQAEAWGLLDGVVEGEALLSSALEAAERFAGFPAQPYRLTKRFNNRRLAELLESVRHDAADVHWTCIRERFAQPHFQKILGRQPADAKS